MTQAAPRSVASVLDDAVRRLRDAGVADPRRDASVLMGLALDTDRGGVAARKPDAIAPAAAARFAELLNARVRRAPMQHVSGRTEFFGLELTVGPAVLIPRPETEGLVQCVLEAGLPERARIADLGTGSGCIAIALAVFRPGWAVTAVDVSTDALAVGSANGARHGLSERIAWVAADFAAPPAAWTGVFDAVVSNPPYVSEAEWRELDPEVRDHEPRRALVPGPGGNEAYAALAPAAFAMLVPGGVLALELGWKSEGAVRSIVTEAGFSDVAVRPDERGIARVLTARRSA